MISFFEFFANFENKKQKSNYALKFQLYAKAEPEYDLYEDGSGDEDETEEEEEIFL